MRSRLFLLGFPVLLALAAPAFARETLDSILPQIRAAHPGRLSDAEPFIGDDGNTHYRIKWMTPEGRILYFDADTRSGRYWNYGGSDGGQWRGGSDRAWHGGDSGQTDEGRDRRRHDNWNGNGPDNFGGGDGRDHPGGGDWGRRDGGGWRGGDWGGGRGGGDWRGGHGGGDNGGHHHGGH